jgi:hypothetical protein
MHFRKIFLLSFFALLACGGGGKTLQKKQSGMPDWILNPSEKYSKKYLLAVGSSTDQMEAELNAYNGISRIFQAKVNSSQSLSTYIKETGSGADMEFSRSVDLINKVNVKSGFNVLNTSILERYQDPKTGKFYALAAMDKFKTSQIYSQQLEENEEKIRSTKNNYQEITDTFQKIAAIRKLLAMLEVSDMMRQALRVLGRGAVENEFIEFSTQLDKDKSDLLEKIHVYLHSETKIPAMISSAVSESVTNSGLKTSTESDASLVVLKMSFKHEPIELKGNPNKFTLWNFSVELIRNDTGASLSVFTEKGRTGQLTYDAAVQRAYYDISGKVKKKFSNFLNKNLFN